MVFLLREGQEVPDGAENEQGNGGRLLESHRKRQGDIPGEIPRRNEEDPRLLQG